ncbi:MAG: hypothetical protein EOO75_20730, partial [Myxococcales bacterium]
MKARGPLLLTAIALLAPAPGRAETPAGAPEAERRAQLAARLSVARSADAGDCPDGAQLAALVAPLLHGPRLLDARVDVQVTRDGGGYAARLRVSGARRGQRSLDDAGATCAALA